MKDRKPKNRPRSVQSILLPIERIPATVSTAIAKQIQATMINSDLGLWNVVLRVSSIGTWPARPIWAESESAHQECDHSWPPAMRMKTPRPVSYTHLRAHETVL